MIRYSGHVSMLFTDLPAVERPAAAKAAGFSLIESWWPVADDATAWADAVETAGVGVSCLNADGGNIAAGERGFCNLTERDADTYRAVGEALRLAMAVGSPCVNVLPGLVVDDRPREAQVDHAVEVYRALGTMATACNVTIVVEPINAVDVPAYLLPTPADVAALLERVAHPSVRMLFDAYHCARGGLDPVAEIHRFGHLIGHAQYADCPGRGAPGTGDVPLEDVVSALAAVGYRGALGMEYAPDGPTTDSLGYLTA